MKTGNAGLKHYSGYSFSKSNPGLVKYYGTNFTLPKDTCTFTGKVLISKTKNKESANTFNRIKDFFKQDEEFTPVGNSKFKYKFSNSELKIAAGILTKPETLQYEAIIKLVDEGFVCIKDKNSALEIFKNYHNSLLINPNSKIFVLDPHEDSKKKRNIGTSNEYMCKWYAQANGLKEEAIINAESIEDMVKKSAGYNDIIIIVPDDCSITGRSLTAETVRCLNKADFPKDKNIMIVFCPLIDSPCAKKVFDSISNFDMEKLKKTGSLNSRDYKIMEKFFLKYRNAKIIIPDDIIEAKPFYDLPYFKKLTDENLKLAQDLYSIMSCNGERIGYGRPGTSGLMIAIPQENGILKCPNNNTYSAASFALIAGANAKTIKRPNRNISVKEWQNELENMFLAMLKQ